MGEFGKDSKLPASDSISFHRQSPLMGEDPDGICDDLISPTEEEKRALRRVPDTIPWSAYLIAFVEFAERFSFYGTTVVYVNFLQQPLPPGSHTGAGGADGQSGALGLRQRTMFALVTFNTFWVYLTPLFGAYIADTYWGRYKTICFSIGIVLLGHILLIVSAVPGVIDIGRGTLGIFILAAIILGIGTGLFKANISPLVAEQYQMTELFVITTKTGERVIVDPALTHSRVYMYYYLLIQLGGLTGSISMTYAEKFVGFYLSFTLPTVVFLLCPVVLYAGRKRYIKTPPAGSVLITSIRAWRFCARDKWCWNPITTWRNFRAPGFWAPVKPSNIGLEDRKPWMTFDDNWVDEIQRAFNACIVFCWYPLYWVAYNQLIGNLTPQAATLSTHGLPNDILSNLDPLAIVILIPLCDLLIYPAIRRLGFHFTSIKKITLGFLTGSAAMIWAAVVQHYIYKTNPCGEHASLCPPPKVSPLTVWVQSGAYILIAISEILASITGLEYAFTKAPKNMRSLVMSVFFFTIAIGAAIGEGFVALSADPLLIWNYGTIAILAAISGTLFWWTFKGIDKREDDLNTLPAGNLGAVTPQDVIKQERA